MRALYAVSYTEYERGWGCRPDGCSFHRSKEEADAYVARLAGPRNGPVPDEYTNADGPPRLVEVSQSLYDKVQADGDYFSFKLNDPDRARSYEAPKPKEDEWPIPRKEL